MQDLVVHAGLEPDRVAVAGPERELGLQVLDVVAELPPAVALLLQVVGDPPGRIVAVASSDRRLPDEAASLASLRVNVTVERSRRLRGDEVHDPPTFCGPCASWPLPLRTSTRPIRANGASSTC